MSTIAFYTGASGLRAYQSALNVTGHNIANVQTTGYKARRASFDDLIRNRINTNVEGEHLVGHGVKQEYVDNIMNQGSLRETFYELDFAIAGDGFFAVDSKGQREYTRNGEFDLSVTGNTATLVTSDGAYVLDSAGQRITLTPDENGAVDTSGLADRLGVFGFTNPGGLTSQNSSRFTVSDNSGAAQLLTKGAEPGQYELKQGWNESSTVELAKEMTNVINAQRAYQLSARIVQTADALAETVNNLR